jgi:N-carbamoyl-D-amino-acid hydrolase
MGVGYNSATYDPNGGDNEDAVLRSFHAKLAVQASAYMNATLAVAIAKAGVEDRAPARPAVASPGWAIP